MTVASTNAELGLIGARPIAARPIAAKQSSPWRLSVELGTILARHNDAAAPIGAPARSGRHRLVRVGCVRPSAKSQTPVGSRRRVSSSRRSQPSKRTLTAHSDARRYAGASVTRTAARCLCHQAGESLAWTLPGPVVSLGRPPVVAAMRGHLSYPESCRLARSPGAARE